jgi:protein-disulfide isomerase
MAKNVQQGGRGAGQRPNIVKASKRGGPGRGFWIALGAVAIVGVGALSWVASRPKTSVSKIDPSLPALKAEGYVMGSPTAPVEITEYADFECPSCGNYATITEPDIRARFVNTGLVRVRYLDFPLPMHKNTWDASLAASCANDQGKFWEMHDQIFANQDQWNTEATSHPRKPLATLAEGLRLDMAKYNTCMDNETHRPQIQANQSEGEQRQINQTPTFVIGGQVYPGALSFDNFKKIIESELAKHPAAKTDSTKIGT